MRTYAEVMGQNYSQFKIDSISKIASPPPTSQPSPANKQTNKQTNKTNKQTNKCVQCPGVVCDLATPLTRISKQTSSFLRWISLTGLGVSSMTVSSSIMARSFFCLSSTRLVRLFCSSIFCREDISDETWKGRGGEGRGGEGRGRGRVSSLHVTCSQQKEERYQLTSKSSSVSSVMGAPALLSLAV